VVVGHEEEDGGGEEEGDEEDADVSELVVAAVGARRSGIWRR
jgi:hypothetical protein